MNDIIAFLGQLSDPQWIMNHGFLYLVMFIIFAETGILIGFFLPGDPLLFITGVLLAQYPGMYLGSGPLNLLFALLLLTTAAIIGNFLGYWIGKKWGHSLMNRKDGWLFKKKYLEQAHDFYEKKGGGAIILARFIPVVRTFAPLVAGIVDMSYKKFSYYNILGGIIWVGSIVSAGYLLGENEWVKHNLEFIIIGIVVVATAPVVIKMIAGKFKKKPQSVGITKEEEELIEQ
jgi:membrane-associated protein